MDGGRFDRLARLLGSHLTRREGLTAILTTLAMAAGRSTSAAGVRSESCLRNGRRCGRRSRKKGKQKHTGEPCGHCCTHYAIRKRCQCRGAGLSCTSRGQCCSGECVAGACSDTCIKMAKACDPGVDVCCTSGAVCDAAAEASGSVCCLPAGFPCDEPADCCGGICDGEDRRCLDPEPD